MNSESNMQSVIVTDIHMPFWSMVIFMVKWLASIPAIIILTLIAALAWRVLTDLNTKTVVVISAPSSVHLC